jgi:hypothetical protein
MRTQENRATIVATITTAATAIAKSILAEAAGSAVVDTSTIQVSNETVSPFILLPAYTAYFWP